MMITKDTIKLAGISGILIFASLVSQSAFTAGKAQVTTEAYCPGTEQGHEQ